MDKNILEQIGKLEQNNKNFLKNKKKQNKIY